MFIDTHAHLFDEYYDNIDSIIDKAKERSVLKIIISGCDTKSNIEVLDKVNKYSCLYGAIGIHPLNALNVSDDDFLFLEKNIVSDKIVAIGEIGLDYHYENVIKDKQKEVFVRQIEIAIKYNKPVIIHCRDAFSDMINILKQYKGKIKGVIHCFSSSLEIALEIINLGLYIGIGGIVTFKNANNIINVIKNIDLKYVLLETDSPYITPEPYRGKQNEPSNIVEIANKISEILDVDISLIRDVTTSNATTLFDIFDKI